MAGYAGTPLPRKLGIAAGHRVAFAGAPKDFRHALGPLPDGVAVRTRIRGPLDVIVAFFIRHSALERHFPPLAAARAGRRAVDRVAETLLGLDHRPDRGRRARDRDRPPR
jgi:hypothetical protein